ncbi:MAG: chemotaxis protein CheA [Pseudomonadales bacterium]|nr:chemotaxis protein CheA [Pseudomonadales bacterium]
MLDDDSFAEIKQIFIEEADEGLDIMESGLLELTDKSSDSDREAELINDIFRAAHSIKGGSATFGFNHVAEFTHLMETMLDEMREGSRSPSADCIQVLLESVDCLREMMNAVKEERSADSKRNEEVTRQLEVLLGYESKTAAENHDATKENESNSLVSETEKSASDDAGFNNWRIRFEPSPGILQSGNDPARLFRELNNLGQLEIDADISQLPALADLDPESCYVAWTLNLHSDCSHQDIEEVFEWVADECVLSIENNRQVGAAEHSEDATGQTSQESQTDTTKTENLEEKLSSKPTNTGNTVRNEGGSIRVGIDKIDSLLNLVGELVITQAMLNRYSSDEFVDAQHGTLGELHDGLAQLESNARELQDVAMKMRMLPIKTTFARFPRLVHDLSLQLGKKVELKIIGEQTELDKTVLEKIGDPLVHLVRNALDHGLETPEQRSAANKPETGSLTLKASHEAGNIVIEVSDDGAGLQHNKIIAKAIEKGLLQEGETIEPEAVPYLVFQPGFSTAQSISDVSGRGVGMDVVKKNIQDLGGRVDVKSDAGQGSTFTIRLPLTLAILDGQLVRIQQNTYVVPLLSIIETVVVDESRLNLLASESMVYRLRNEYIPVINMVKLLNTEANELQGKANPATASDIQDKLMVIVESGSRVVGLVVDDLQDQQQVVLKSLEANYQQIQGLAGATILGDGTVSMIIDIPGIIEICFGAEDAGALGEIAAA